MYRRALKSAIGICIGITIGWTILPRLFSPERYNDSYPPVVLHIILCLVVSYAVSFLIYLLIEWAKSKFHSKT